MILDLLLEFCHICIQNYLFFPGQGLLNLFFQPSEKKRSNDLMKLWNYLNSSFLFNSSCLIPLLCFPARSNQDSNSSRDVNIWGKMKFNKDQSSAKLFCRGIPVKRNLFSARFSIHSTIYSWSFLIGVPHQQLYISSHSEPKPCYHSKQPHMKWR